MKFKIKNKKSFIFLILLVIVFFYSLSAVFIFDYQIDTPFYSTDQEEKIFVIESGQGLEKIAENLNEAGLIKSKWGFIGYIAYKDWTTKLQAGEYALSSSLSIRQISRKIVEGDAITHEARIVIPEGFTLKQIDARLANNGLIKQGELLAKPELEGYMFPDTYDFNRDATLDEIIVVMMDNFDKKLDDNLVAEIQRQGKTIKEIITMASIIEKELPLYNDKRIISGIFWNRVGDNYPLQSCATIAYILGVDKWIYSTEDTKVDSLYNTYQNIGLPPGPINNPGILSIKAAVYPINTDYYFFLSAPDGQTIYSKTFEEHLDNKAKYLN